MMNQHEVLVQSAEDVCSGDISLETTVPTDLTVSPPESDDTNHTTHRGKVTRNLLERKQLAHDVQRLKIELSQKNLIIDNLKLQNMTKIEELEEKINETLHQKKMMQTRLENQLKIVNEELQVTRAKTQSEITTLLSKQEEHERMNRKLVETSDAVKHGLNNLTLTKDGFKKLKSKSIGEMSIKEYAALKIYQAVWILNEKNNQLTPKIQATEDALRQSNISMKQLKQDFLRGQSQYKELLSKYEKATSALNVLTERVEHGNFKLENFDRIQRERDDIRGEKLDFVDKMTLMKGNYELVCQERNDLKSQLQLSNRKSSFINEEKERLLKQVSELTAKCGSAEDRCNQLSTELDKSKLSRENLYEKFVSVRDQYKNEYERRLEHEINDIRLKTSTEIDKIHVAVKNMYERETRTLQESLSIAQKAREYAELSDRESKSKYEQLLLELKSLQSQDLGQISDLRSELKVRTFQLEQVAKSNTEVERDLVTCRNENEKLRSKVELLSNEVQRLQMTSSQRVLQLESELSHRTRQLEIYEKLEHELDEVVLRSAHVADDLEAERVISSYGLTGNIPTTSKRRLEQSMRLAKQVLGLERELADVRGKLDGETTKADELGEKLSDAERLLEMTKQPHGYIVGSLKEKDETIRSSKKTTSSLQAKIDRLKADNDDLIRSRNELSGDLERLLNNREEMATMRQVIFQMQKNYVEGTAKDSDKKIREKLKDSEKVPKVDDCLPGAIQFTNRRRRN